MSNGKKILVIDDEPYYIDAVRMRLEAMGYDVQSAEDGRQGFDRARKERPGLILLDLVMPASNGFETLSRLKADPATSYIPVIVVSAKVETEYVVDAGSLGAVDYIMKPVPMDTLVEKIQRYV